MKKIEAQAIAIERSKLIIEYITQILSDSEKVAATMNFSSTKINNQSMCVLDIYVSKNNFERHLNLGITNNHILVLYEQLLNDLLNTFLEHETIGVTKYYSIKSQMGSFSGVDAVNLLGGRIKINLNGYGYEFDNLISEYTKKYDELAKKINSENKGQKLK